jgi:hypothetical protein
MFASGAWHKDDKLWQVSAFIKRIRALPAGVMSAVKPRNAK